MRHRFFYVYWLLLTGQRTNGVAQQVAFLFKKLPQPLPQFGRRCNFEWPWSNSQWLELARQLFKRNFQRLGRSIRFDQKGHQRLNDHRHVKLVTTLRFCVQEFDHGLNVCFQFCFQTAQQTLEPHQMIGEG